MFMLEYPAMSWHISCYVTSNMLYYIHCNIKHVMLCHIKYLMLCHIKMHIVLCSVISNIPCNVISNILSHTISKILSNSISNIIILYHIKHVLTFQIFYPESNEILRAMSYQIYHTNISCSVISCHAISNLLSYK